MEKETKKRRKNDNKRRNLRPKRKNHEICRKKVEIRTLPEIRGVKHRIRMIMKDFLKMFALFMLVALLCTLAALAILPMIKIFDNIVIEFLTVLPIITLASFGITALLNIAIDKFF